MSKIIIPEEIRSEFRLDKEGKAFLSIRASARLLNIDDSGLVRHFQSAEKNPTNLTQKLIEKGFQVLTFSLDGIPDVAFAEIAEYYAMDAGKRCTQQAKMVYKAFAAIGVRTWIQSELHWQQPQVQHLTPSQALLQSVMMLVEIEHKLAIQDQRLMVIEAEKQQATEELTRLPLSSDLAPSIPLRGKINMIVRNKAQRDLISYNALWSKLYQQMYYRLSYDVKARCRHSGMKPLDQIEKDKMFDALYAIASEVLT
ncbi:hypothetical protein C7H19_24155 [Aphanothece hegewaldii CCALA 016]|uniref:Uncharacterized protein n=1 Tax=Aphanothece hegewaldii CCALA 016 TaxID=2107694 RepID=A0A2T1LQV4_9CHRO|nr:hypothetical protein [Aphanothece hegewaldii]PSF30023.1 hypothetical protein C7H19_24155 [Aphanothece hegewaldii CCALA 016]